MSESDVQPVAVSGQNELKLLLANAKTIAIVGLSTDPSKASFLVARYLKSRNYRIIPVNPSAVSILGEKCFSSLSEIPEMVDIVNVFRKQEALPGIIEEAIEIKAKAVWIQEGVVTGAVLNKAKKIGMKVVMDRCIMKAHLECINRARGYPAPLKRKE